MADVEARRIRATTVHTRQNSLDVATTSGRVYEVGYPDQYGTEVVHQLRKAAVDFDVKKGGAGPVQAVLPFLLPVALLGACWFILARRRRGGPGDRGVRARSGATARDREDDDVRRRRRRGRSRRGTPADHRVRREPGAVSRHGRAHPQGRTPLRTPGHGKTLRARSVAGQSSPPGTAQTSSTRRCCARAGLIAASPWTHPTSAGAGTSSPSTPPTSRSPPHRSRRDRPARRPVSPALTSPTS